MSPFLYSFPRWILSLSEVQPSFLCLMSWKLLSLIECLYLRDSQLEGILPPRGHFIRSRDMFGGHKKKNDNHNQNAALLLKRFRKADLSMMFLSIFLHVLWLQDTRMFLLWQDQPWGTTAKENLPLASISSSVKWGHGSNHLRTVEIMTVKRASLPQCVVNINSQCTSAIIVIPVYLCNIL